MPDFMNLLYSSLCIIYFLLLDFFIRLSFVWTSDDAASMEGVPSVLSTGIVARRSNHLFEANRIGPVRRTVA